VGEEGEEEISRSRRRMRSRRSMYVL